VQLKPNFVLALEAPVYFGDYSLALADERPTPTIDTSAVAIAQPARLHVVCPETVTFIRSQRHGVHSSRIHFLIPFQSVDAGGLPRPSAAHSSRRARRAPRLGARLRVDRRGRPRRLVFGLAVERSPRAPVARSSCRYSPTATSGALRRCAPTRLATTSPN